MFFQIKMNMFNFILKKSNKTNSWICPFFDFLLHYIAQYFKKNYWKLTLEVIKMGWWICNLDLKFIDFHSIIIIKKKDIAICLENERNIWYENNWNKWALPRRRLACQCISSPHQEDFPWWKRKQLRSHLERLVNNWKGSTATQRTNLRVICKIWNQTTLDLIKRTIGGRRSSPWSPSSFSFSSQPSFLFPPNPPTPKP